MKRTILAFALPLLLALAPTAAPAARILWIGIDETATLVDETGKLLENETLSTYRFQSSDKALNAAKVSVGDGNGGSEATFLCFVYEDNGLTVVDDPDSQTVMVNLSSGTGDTPGDTPGDTTDTTSDWLAAYLGDIAGGDLVVTLELGYFDWTAPSSEFERMVYTTSTLSTLEANNYLAPMASLHQPIQQPWTPQQYTVVPVPEPSVCCTALLGVLLLAKRRKAGRPRGAAGEG